MSDTIDQAQSAAALEEAALRMFPSMAPQEPTERSAPAAHASAAAAGATEAPKSSVSGDAALPAPDAPDDIELRALRADAAYNLYSRSEAARVVPETTFEHLVGQTIEVDGEVVEIDRGIAQKAVVELRAMAADLELSSSDMPTVRQALEFGQSIKGEPEKAIAARESAVEMLNAEHGREAALAASAARAFVAKNPKLASLLERTGAGDSPELIARIARRALALHKAGGLKLAAAPSASGGSESQRMFPASKMNP